MIGTLMTGYAIGSLIISLLLAYSIQAIADKNDLSAFARFLAWVPVLSIYPWLLSAGASIRRFLLASAGLAIASVAIAVINSISDSITVGAIFTVLAVCVALALVVYFGRLSWDLAERRNLSGWIGLLLFVPFANLFVLFYIAFHDGLVPLNKAGFAIGLMLTLGAGVADYQLRQTMSQGAGLLERTFAQAEQPIDPATDEAPAEPRPLAQQRSAVSTVAKARSGDGSTTSNADHQSPEDLAATKTTEAVRAMMQMGDHFEALMALDSADPSQAARLQALLEETHVELAMQRRALGEEATREFLRQLDGMSARLLQQRKRPTPDSTDPLPQARAGRRPGKATAGSSTSMTLPARGGAPPARLAAQPGGLASATAEVPETCPAGAVLRGARPPRGRKAWCERIGTDAGVKHGWVASWHASGQLESTGQYRDGVRVGTWTRWYPNGTRRAQARFKEGVQDGLMTAWDQSGNVSREVLFRAGAAVSR